MTMSDVRSALPAPTRVSQATAVEQSRAVAEVQGAIVVAQQCPRSIQAARLAMQDSCSQAFMAERAFFRYKRASSQITGPTIDLARELARCWTNVQYGIAELSRDDGHGQSEILAFAWDVQMNTRASNTFIAPHRRDTRDGSVELTDMRDIYENNTNLGSRRVREMIFSILPAWFVEEAKELCNKTLSGGGDEPLAERINKVLVAFAGLKVGADQIEQKIGRAKDEWNPYDLAQLRVIYRSIQRREVTVEDEFPAPRVTAAEIVGAQTQSKAAEPAPAKPEPVEDNPLHYDENEVAESEGGQP